MADCAACGAKLEDGITRCPQCRAPLGKPGSLLQIGGWVLFFMSWVPIVVGVETFRQGSYVPLAVGIGLTVSGVSMIIVGRARSAAAPDPTRPSAGPAGVVGKT